MLLLSVMTYLPFFMGFSVTFCTGFVYILLRVNDRLQAMAMSDDQQLNAFIAEKPKARIKHIRLAFMISIVLCMLLLVLLSVGPGRVGDWTSVG